MFYDRALLGKKTGRGLGPPEGTKYSGEPAKKRVRKNVLKGGQRIKAHKAYHIF